MMKLTVFLAKVERYAGTKANEWGKVGAKFKSKDNPEVEEFWINADLKNDPSKVKRLQNLKKGATVAVRLGGTGRFMIVTCSLGLMFFAVS